MTPQIFINLGNMTRDQVDVNMDKLNYKIRTLYASKMTIEDYL